MKKEFLFVLICFFSATNGFAQKLPCAFHLEQSDSVRQFEESVARWIRENKINGRTELNIQVVVHIVTTANEENISDERILNQLEALNRDFFNENKNIDRIPSVFKSSVGVPKIHFCLAQKDTNGQTTTGIVRYATSIQQIGLKEALFHNQLGGSTAWNTHQYLNIWVANTGNIIAGLGTYPAQVPLYKMGVIVHPKFFGIQLGRTLVHEVGHFLGLKHLWGDVGNCQGDDEVADTPVQRRAYTSCPIHPQNQCANAEMFMNYMDYVNDECMLLFTEGQAERMRATLQNYRKGLTEYAQSCPQGNQNFAPIRVFPNPTSGTVLVDLAATHSIVEYRILNTVGQIMDSRKIIVNQQLTLDLSNYPNGLYVLQIVDNDNFYSAKVLKSK